MPCQLFLCEKNVPVLFFFKQAEKYGQVSVKIHPFSTLERGGLSYMCLKTCLSACDEISTYPFLHGPLQYCYLFYLLINLPVVIFPLMYSGSFFMSAMAANGKPQLATAQILDNRQTKVRRKPLHAPETLHNASICQFTPTVGL